MLQKLKKLFLTQIKCKFILYSLKDCMKAVIVNDVIDDYQTNVSFEFKFKKREDLSSGNTNILN